jgi:hypothetical protein
VRGLEEEDAEGLGICFYFNIDVMFNPIVKILSIRAHEPSSSLHPRHT